MSTSITTARRAREFASREELILREASKFLLERGFQGWNMDDLAKAVEYSKGTLYQHFESKEDLALAVCTGSLQQRSDLFEKASQFKGGTRERVRAICCACCEFATAHPDYFHAEMTLKSVSFWDKASEERREDHRIQASRCWRTLQQIIIEAQAIGDLPRDRIKPEEATFALISVTVGSHIMAMEGDLRVMAGITDPLIAVRRNGDLMCDGLGWKPMSYEMDSHETDKRIVREVFPSATWLQPR
ncbi:MAG: TetR/AcrR family transcriptional regulator [Verrucomicrobiaceae bacterium]